MPKNPKPGVIGLSLTRDGKTLVAAGADGIIRVWDVKSGRELKTLVHSDSPDVDTSTYSVVFSRDGKKIYVGNGATSVAEVDEKKGQYVYLRTYVWNIETGEKLFTFEGQKFDVGGLVFTPDNRYLISGSADRTIKFYDLKTGKEARTLIQPIANVTN